MGVLAQPAMVMAAAKARTEMGKDFMVASFERVSGTPLYACPPDLDAAASLLRMLPGLFGVAAHLQGEVVRPH